MIKSVKRHRVNKSETGVTGVLLAQQSPSIFHWNLFNPTQLRPMWNKAVALLACVDKTRHISAFNESVVRTCRRRGIPVWQVQAKLNCDWLLPCAFSGYIFILTTFAEFINKKGIQLG